jgi:hypothetical protein
MDIATKFASGQEAVEAIFWKDKQPQGRQQEDVPEASSQRGAKKAKKKLQAKRDTADADLVAATEHRNPRKPPGGANLFNKMLKELCPYHQGPVKHTLEECVMLRRYFHKVGPPAEGGKGQDNDKKEGNKADEFPEVHGCFMIYGGCRCFGSDRTPGVAPQGVFRSRTVSTTVAKWFVSVARGTMDKICRFGPLRSA